MNVRGETIVSVIIWVLISVMLALAFAVAWTFAESLENKSHRIEELQNKIERLQEEDNGGQTGGAETSYSAQDSTETGMTFPIAKSDYIQYTSPFGLRESPLAKTERVHSGLDIAGVWRAQVVAVSDGVVVEHWPPPDGHWKGHEVYGGMVLIEHDNGVRSLYAHLSSTRVYQGMQVNPGETIGRIGNTGDSDGPHLHFELRIDGEPVNPLLYIEDPTKETENENQSELLERNPLPYPAQ